MRKRLSGGLAGLAALFAATLLGAADKPAPGLVRIGMIQTLFRGSEVGAMLASTAPFSELLYSQTGIRGQFCIIESEAEMARQLMSGELDLAVMHGIEYAWVMQQNPELRPLVIAYNQTHRLKAYLVVRDESPIQSVADLKGKSLALPKRVMNHCHLFLHRSIADSGNDPCGFFCCNTTPHSMEAAMDGVVNEKYDAAVVDGVAMEVYATQKPARSKRLRVIQESNLFPTASIIYRPNVCDPEVARKFQAGMITAHERLLGRQLLTLWRLSNFAPVPEEYPQMLVDVLKDYPTPFLPAKFIAEPAAEAAPSGAEGSR